MRTETETVRHISEEALEFLSSKTAIMTFYNSV